MYFKKHLIEFEKIAITCLLFSTVFSAFAQLDTVRIDVIGLTCSSCSKSVEEKLIQVDFVKSVHMNLNLNEAKIVVDYSKNIRWETLAKAVYDAGFSVGAFVIPSCAVLPIGINNKSCEASYVYAGDATTQRLDNQVYQLIGKFYMDKKSFRNWKKKMTINNQIVSPDATIYYYY